MCHHSCLTAAKITSSNLLSSAVAELLNENDSAQSNSPAYQQAASRASPAVRKRVVTMAESIKKKKKKQTKLKDDSESEEEDLDFVVADSDDGSRDGDDDLDRAEGKRKRDSSSDEDSSDSDSDSDDDDDIDHVMSKDEVAALKKDQGNVIPRAKRRAALASGIGDASALEAIQQAKPDSDEEAEFEF